MDRIPQVDEDRVAVWMLTPTKRAAWTAADMAEIFARRVIDGLLANDLTPTEAAYYASRAAHYAGQVLAEGGR